jgi:hypothetical protein
MPRARPHPIALTPARAAEPQREVQQRFETALAALVERVKGDRTILAAVLRGSLARDTVWEKSTSAPKAATPAANWSSPARPKP